MFFFIKNFQNVNEKSKIDFFFNNNCWNRYNRIFMYGKSKIENTNDVEGTNILSLVTIDDFTSIPFRFLVVVDFFYFFSEDI